MSLANAKHENPFEISQRAKALIQLEGCRQRNKQHAMWQSKEGRDREREREREEHHGYWAGAAASFVRQKAGNTKYYSSSCTLCVPLSATVCACVYLCVCLHICLRVCAYLPLCECVCACVCVQVKLEAEVRLDLLNSFARSFVTACTYFYCCCCCCCSSYLPPPPPQLLPQPRLNIY